MKIFRWECLSVEGEASQGALTHCRASELHNMTSSNFIHSTPGEKRGWILRLFPEDKEKRSKTGLADESTSESTLAD